MAKIDKVLRVGVIGPGGMGRERTREFAATPGVEVVAAADNNAETLDRMEQHLTDKVPGFKAGSVKKYVGDFEFLEMLDKEDLDIVGVFSPHSLHDVHGKAALRTGCHVMIEKPMANFVGDAIQLVRMANGSDRHLMIQYQRHYHPLYVTAKTLVEDGSIGDVKEFEVFLAQRWGGGGWRGDPRFSGGGQPNDSGSHLQDIFLWITGLLPQQVTGTTSKTFVNNDGATVERPIEIDAKADVAMDNGARGTITIVGNTKIGFEEYVVLKGAKGTLNITRDGKLVSEKNGKEETVAPSIPHGYPKSNIDNLVGLIRGTYDTNYTSGINGVRTSWLTNSILAAGRQTSAPGKVDCDSLIEHEGYSRSAVQELIADSRKHHRL